jgi:hypothetical protein
MKAKQYGSQHYVPRTYLKAWCDPDSPKRMEPYVWVFDRTGENSRRRAPKNLFEETDFYTIQMPDGRRDLVLEHGLQELEDKFARLRDEKLIRQIPVSIDEGSDLFAFIIAMSFRTKAHRERRRAEWQQIADAMERAERNAPIDSAGIRARARFSFSTNPNDPSLGIEDVRRLADEPVQHMLAVDMATYLPVVAGMEMLVMRTEDAVGFITSDDPCIWINDRVNPGPPAIRQLGNFGVLMPLSPREMLFLNAFRSGYARLQSRSVVDEYNRLTRQHASSEIVVCRNELRREWFEP